MVVDLCNQKLEEYTRLAGSFSENSHVGVLCFCVGIGNIFVILALWKALSIPTSIKKLLMSLAFSDFAVGLVVYSTADVWCYIIAWMLNVDAGENYQFEFFFCPINVTIPQFSLYFLVTASCLSVAGPSPSIDVSQ